MSSGKSASGNSARVFGGKANGAKTGTSKTATKARAEAARRGTRSAVLRRPPEKGWALFRYRVQMGWSSALEEWPLWSALFLIVGVWCLLPRQLFEVPRVAAGDIAARTYIAERDLSITDREATEKLEADARRKVPPVYDFDRTEIERARLRFAELFEAGRKWLASSADQRDAEQRDAEQRGAEQGGTDQRPPDSPLAERLGAAANVTLRPDIADWLGEQEFSTEVEDRLKGLAVRVLRQGVVDDKTRLLENRERGITVQELPSKNIFVELDIYRYLDTEQLRETVEQELRGWAGLRSDERRLLADFTIANISPNLTYNSSETLALRQSEADKVGAVLHQRRQGEVIVRKGERVDELAARTIDALADSRDRGQLWLAGLGIVLLLLAAAVLVWLFAGLETRRDRGRQRLFNECLILLTVHLLSTRFAFFIASAIAGSILSEPWNSLTSYVYVIPFPALALVGILFYGRNVAFVLALVAALLVGPLVGAEAVFSTTVYALAGSLAAIFILDRQHFRQRSVMIRAGTWVGLLNAVTVVMLQALEGLAGSWSQLGFDLLCAFAGGLLAAAVASFAVPIFESLFGVTTYIKLLEIANPNLPLLRRLALEAPGTFQHSLAVANLSKAGCEAIGLDAVLVYTAALYHDIGKLFRPHYFVENQAPGQNPHDKIQPSMSALILINHVKEGLETGYKHQLPRPILDAVEQHHGTRLIKFFYNRAQERCDPETEAVREDDFRYPGPKPQSKEMGILMLADAVEAASRTLVEPSRQKIIGLVRTLFEDCLNDHQLDQTDLTLGDLRRVEEAFVNVLTKIYHRRVEYPGYDFNRPDTRSLKDRLEEREATRPKDGEPPKGDSSKSTVPRPVDEAELPEERIEERLAS